MTDGYLADVLIRFAVEHGHAAPTEERGPDGSTARGFVVDLPETDAERRALLATWCDEAKDAAHGDRVPAVCAEARRLLAGVRCPEPCCAEFVGFADPETAVCTNTACGECWPDRCECGDPASGHTDAGCPPKFATKKDEGRFWHLHDAAKEIIASFELLAAAGLEVAEPDADMKTRLQQIGAEAAAIVARKKYDGCTRSAAVARRDRTGKHRWNEVGGLVELAA